MGADLNAFAERLGPGGWEMCRFPTGGYFTPPCVGDRDTILFATLGPNPWGIPVEPISAPRGLPLDLSAEGRAWAGPTIGKPYYVGHSWLLVSELLAFPWIERWTDPRLGLLQESSVRQAFLAVTLPALAALGPPEEVRLILWVDF